MELKDWTAPTLRRLVESDEALSKGPDSPHESVVPEPGYELTDRQ